MLEIKNLTVKINDKIFINNLNMTVNRNDKIAIIGEEGNGKSTLLKAIYGNYSSNVSIEGSINNNGNKIGYLKQMLLEEELDKSVKKYLFDNELDFYYHTNEIYNLINLLKINDKLLDYDKMNQLSGGEKVKLQLLKLLLENNDILLLDEPTNDLDIESLKWLEKFIQENNQPIIFVSHDEFLLDNAANAILHLEIIKRKTVAKHTFSKNKI